METIKKERPFKLAGSFHFNRMPAINNIIENVVERLLALHHLDRLYLQLPEVKDNREFLQQVFDVLKISYEVKDGDIAHIPSEGPAVVVANHPFGALEGVIMAHLLQKVRPDVKILANHYLTRIPELRELIIPVDVFEKNGSQVKNIKPMREAMRWLDRGGLLMVFPAGEVSHIQPGYSGITDPEWNPAIARIIRKTHASVTPIYFHGTNSLLFQLMGLAHPRLRTALIPRELTNKANRIIHTRIAPVIPHEKLATIESDEEMIRYLRLQTYMLRDLNSNKAEVKQNGNHKNKSVEAVLAEQDKTILKREIDALPGNQCLVKHAEMGVYYARTSQIPYLLQEIGRLRELTFREAGEGTGKSIDLDYFDKYYLHLFVWNHEELELVAAYRLGLTDEIVPQFGKKGLYTQSLFKYGREVLEKLDPAIELGRSFVRLEYQRSYAPLMLLWKGIGHFVSQNPRYRILFGPVSISSEYCTVSQQLMVDFLKANNFLTDMAKYVKPRNPFRGNRHPTWKNTGLPGLKDIDSVSELVAQIESDSKGAPILLKQYMNLGGQFLGFNIDPHFNDSLDGLIMVDLMQSDRKILRRYMGNEEAKQFLDYHEHEEKSLLKAS